MPHAIRPYEDQRNRATLKGTPLPTAIEIQFPETFSARARHVIEDLGDTVFLFIANGRFVVTDETCMLDKGSARWSGDSLEALEEWLEVQAGLKDAEEPGWEQPYLMPADILAGGTQKTVTAITFEQALRIALARGFKRFEFSCGGLSNDIEEYLKDTEGEEDDADYVLFADVIVRIGDAWGRDADVTRLVD